MIHHHVCTRNARATTRKGDRLVQILSYHVHPGDLNLAAALGSKNVDTVEKSPIKVAFRDGAVKVNDASLLEEKGRKILIIPGSYDNIKVTTPEDIELARAIFRRRRKT